MASVKLGGLVSFTFLLFSCCAALALGASVSVSNARRAPQLKESVPPPNGWTQGARAPGTAVLELRIALPQPNFEDLEAHLYAVSDPGHTRYGQHLSKSEVEALVAPHPDSLGAVDAWLAEHGIKTEELERSPALDWVKVRVPVAVAEEMLHTVRPACIMPMSTVP